MKLLLLSLTAIMIATLVACTGQRGTLALTATRTPAQQSPTPETTTHAVPTDTFFDEIRTSIPPAATTFLMPTSTPAPRPTVEETPMTTPSLVEYTVIEQFGTQGSDSASGIVVDDASNIYVMGEIGGPLPGHSTIGAPDIFLRKYDSEGNELWTRIFGSSKKDKSLGMRLDSVGHIYITVSEQEGSRIRVVVYKFDGDGNELWSGISSQGGSKIEITACCPQTRTTDPTGNVYVAGFTRVGLPGQTHFGDNDAFISKYDSEGKELWTRQFGSPRSDRVFKKSSSAIFFSEFITCFI